MMLGPRAPFDSRKEPPNPERLPGAATEHLPAAVGLTGRLTQAVGWRPAALSVFGEVRNLIVSSLVCPVSPSEKGQAVSVGDACTSRVCRHTAKKKFTRDLQSTGHCEFAHP
jgi:hypothetical protein